MTEKNKHYTPDFKENAILLSYKRKSVKETAKELDIPFKLLSKWRTIYKTFKKGSFPGKGKKRIYYEEKKVFELEKKLTESQLKLEILRRGIKFKYQDKQALYNFIHQNKKKFPLLKCARF